MEDSAITHSKTGERSMFIQSCATGHKSGGGPKARTWSLHRNAKLALQAAPKKSSILSGCVVYVNGYVGKELSNEQLKDIVEENGGRVKTMPSAKCTHIFVHQNLSASKIEKFLKCRTNKTRYVYPAWAIDSAKAGRRLSEANYASPVFSETQISVNAVFGTANDVRTLHPAAYETAADIPPTPPRPVLVKSRPQSPPPLHPSPHATSQRRKVRASLPPSPSPKESKRSKKLPPPTPEVIVLQDLSPLEIAEVRSSQGKSAGRESDEEESEEEGSEGEVDEWGMPPSGQRCGRG